MFSAAAIPMWVALVALLGTILTPIINGRVNRTNSKADAAEKFTRIAAGVADDYLDCRAENADLRSLARRALSLLDRIKFTGNPPDVRAAKEALKDLRERL